MFSSWMLMYSIWDVTCLKNKGFIIHPNMKSSGASEILWDNQMVTKSNLQELNGCMVSWKTISMGT